jgi:hypothetical protein
MYSPFPYNFIYNKKDNANHFKLARRHAWFLKSSPTGIFFTGQVTLIGNPTFYHLPDFFLLLFPMLLFSLIPPLRTAWNSVLFLSYCLKQCLSTGSGFGP